MAVVVTDLVDDNFKVIKVVTGKKNADETVIEVDSLKGATNESLLSVANVYYEIVAEVQNDTFEIEKIFNLKTKDLRIYNNKWYKDFNATN